MDVTDIIGRYLDALSRQDLAALASSTTEDLCFRAADRELGKEAFLAMMEGLFAGFPDWSFEHGRLRFGWNHATIELRMHGTHSGVLALPMLDLPPIDPTGRVVVLPPQDVNYTVRDRLVARIEPVRVPGGGIPGIVSQITAPEPAESGATSP